MTWNEQISYFKNGSRIILPQASTSIGRLNCFLCSLWLYWEYACMYFFFHSSKRRRLCLDDMWRPYELICYPHIELAANACEHTINANMCFCTVLFCSWFNVSLEFLQNVSFHIINVLDAWVSVISIPVGSTNRVESHVLKQKCKVPFTSFFTSPIHAGKCKAKL